MCKVFGRMGKPWEALAYVRANDTSNAVPSSGVPVPFENELFKGAICFTLTSHCDDAHAKRVQASDHWEIQIQGRFKTRPEGELCLGGQLPNAPFGVGHVFKSLCGMILDGVKTKKTESGDLLYMPLRRCDCLCRSFCPIALPFDAPASRGTWEWIGNKTSGQWYPIHWRQAGFDTHHYYGFRFSSQYIDFDTWKLTKVPGFGALDLQTVWGRQGLSLQIFDDREQCFAHVEFRHPSNRETCSADLKVYRQDDEVSTGSESSDIGGMECEWHGGFCSDDEQDKDAEIVSVEPYSSQASDPPRRTTLRL